MIFRMFNSLIGVLVLTLVSGPSWASSKEPPGLSFSQAKSVLKKHVDTAGSEDYYCGCKILTKGKYLYVDLKACGYEVRKNERRATRIEYEHVVPAADFGRQRACWRAGGRKNCAKNDAEFLKMEGDPINLLPVVGEVNGDRSANRYGMIEPTHGVGYGQCRTRVDFKARTIMPDERSRGDIARIYFYFQQKYQLDISRQQRQLFVAWHKLDPVDDRECRRNTRIFKQTKFHNPFVTAFCQ